jgi:RHS repeat-associated protein
VSGGNQIQTVTLQQSGGVPTNQIATVNAVGYSYDAAGNVTSDGSHSYTYDAENRVASVDGGAAQYAYDHRNWRVKKLAAGATTHYIWERGQVLAEHNGGGGNLVDYVYAGGKMIAKVASGNTQYFISDRLSVRMTIDSGGNVIGRQAHLPFGEDFAESGNQEKHHFTSYERDGESGLDYAVNRHYSSSIGRFGEVDPARGRPESPQSLNRYTYAQNDPIDHVDPDGRVFGGFSASLLDALFDLLFSGPTIILSTTESFLPELGGGGVGRGWLRRANRRDPTGRRRWR